MWRNTSKFLASLPKKSLRNNINLYSCSALYKPSLFNHNVPVYAFAKKGAKELERMAQKQEKKEASVGKEIDLKEIEDKMKKDLEDFKVIISKIKLGRLSAAHFENMKIVAYGEKRPLSELVQFIPKSANSITLSAFDEGVVTDIVKTLEASKDSLALKRDGKTVNCTLVGGNTKEAKEALVKECKVEFDKVKDKIRTHRTEAMDNIKKLEKYLLKDALQQATKEIQNLNDQFLGDIEKTFKAKEKELLG